MSKSTSPAGSNGRCPIEIAFDETGIPEDCQATGNRVRCSPLSHHAALLPISTGVELGQTLDQTERKGGGMMTAKRIIKPAYRLKTEFGDRIAGGFFADIMTPSHEAAPMTVFYGFRLEAADERFRFADSVGDKVTGHFESAEIVKTGSKRILVVSTTDPFPHQLVEAMRG